MWTVCKTAAVADSRGQTPFGPCLLARSGGTGNLSQKCLTISVSNGCIFNSFKQYAVNMGFQVSLNLTKEFRNLQSNGVVAMSSFRHHLVFNCKCIDCWPFKQPIFSRIGIASSWKHHSWACNVHVHNMARFTTRNFGVYFLVTIWTSRNLVFFLNELKCKAPPPPPPCFTLHGKSIEIPREKATVPKALTFLKKGMDLNCNFQGGGANQKPLHEGVTDIFWNNTMHLLPSISCNMLPIMPSCSYYRCTCNTMWALVHTAPVC